MSTTILKGKQHQIENKQQQLSAIQTQLPISSTISNYGFRPWLKLMISKKVESSLADNHHTTKIKRSPNITFYNQISFIFRTVFSVSQYNFLQFNIFYFQDCVFRLAGTSEDNTEGKGRQSGQILAAKVASSLGKGNKSWS